MSENRTGEGTSSTPTYVSAYAIFEGGGAKGLAHVGALRALQKAGLVPAGVAGTSAGAIFAALVAVGYTPDEIFKDGENHILIDLQRGSPVDLIGAPTWRRLKVAERHLFTAAAGIFVSTVLSTMLGTLALLGVIGEFARGISHAVAAAGIVLILAYVFSKILPKLKSIELAARLTRYLRVAPFVASAVTVALGLYTQNLADYSAVLAGITIGSFIVWISHSASFLLVSGAIASAAILSALVWGPNWPVWIVPVLLFAMMLYTGKIVMDWLPILLHRQGLVDNRVVQEVVNAALRKKLEARWNTAVDGELPETVLFKHIEPDLERNTFIPLKVVTTNVSKEKLVIVDGSYPEVAVAEAVAASAALPLVFQPARISGLGDEDDRFTDGGVVSNLPSWVFRDEKRHVERIEAHDGGLFRRIPIFAMALKGPKDGKPHVLWRVLGLVQVRSYLRNLLNTAVFGGQSVVQNFISDLRVITVQTVLDTMDLDCSGAEAKAQVDDAERQVLEVLLNEQRRDQLALLLLEDIRTRVAPILQEKMPDEAITPESIRTVLIEPLRRNAGGETVALRVRLISGGDQETNTDDDLELDLEGNIAAKAVKSRKPVRGDIHGVGAGPLKMTKYEHALLPRHLRTALAIPIVGPDNSVECVVAVDSSSSLPSPDGDNELVEMLQTITLPFRSDFFDKAMEKLPR